LGNSNIKRNWFGIKINKNDTKSIDDLFEEFLKEYNG